MTELTDPLETAARKTIDASLNNLGWCTDETSHMCNVVTSRAKTRQQARDLGGKQPDYVLYRSGTDEPIGVIEAKQPGKTLKAALEQGSRDARLLSAPIVFATDGNITEARHVGSDEILRIDGVAVTELLNEQTLLRFVKDGPAIETATPTRVSRQDLISAFARANDLLRNEGLREGIERFTEFSNLLFLKLISEIEDERERKDEPRSLERRYCWAEFSERPARDMLDYINDTVLRRLVDQYNGSGDVFQRQLLIENPHTLKAIVDDLSVLTLLDTDSDVKGDAFEYFLKHSVTVGNDLGEYFTPRHIVRLMVDLVDPRFGETVYDPCCGTGGFLICAFEYIKQKIAHGSDVLDALKNETVFGRELTGTATVAKMNMILTGDGHTNIQQMDSLSEPVEGAYDIVLTNYPFSQKTHYAGLYGHTGKDANPVFLAHAIRALKPGGRAAVIVPDGLLFGEKAQYVNIRKSLLQSCEVHAVIQLHPYVFRPYAGQPTSILIFRKGNPTRDVWFFAVDEDGYSKTTSKYGRMPIENDGLMALREAWADERADTDRSHTINETDIAQNHYKLLASAYRGEGPDSSAWLPLGGESGLCDIVTGKTPPSRDPTFWNGGHPWATISDLAGKLVTTTEKSLSDKGREFIGTEPLPEGTLLFSFKLTIAKTAFAGCETHTNEAIAALIPRDDRILPEYLYFILPQLDYGRYTQPTTKGMTLNKKSLARILVPVPPLTQQQSIIRELRAQERKIQKHLDAIDECQAEAASLIQKHISSC